MVLDALQRGEFGDVPGAADKYKRECHKLFPLSTAFAPTKADNTTEELNPSSPDTREQEISGTEPPGQDGVVQ